ncbi:MAG: MCE family protein [Acidimicrobiales bacterium]
MSKRLLVLVLAATAMLTGCNLQPNDRTLPGQVAVGGDGYTVTVYFDDVANLVANSTVQMDNVVIGTVAAIDVVDWQAKVKLRLLKSVRVPSDAVFSVGQKTLLGAQYVEVAEPGAGAAGVGSKTIHASSSVDSSLVDGDVIRADQTGTYPATEQVLGAVALLLNNGGLSQIQTITSELSTALQDRVPDTRSLVRRTNQLLTVLDDNKSEIVGALESLDSLSSGLAADRDRLNVALDRLGPGLRALEQERASLVRAVTEAGQTGLQAGRIISASRHAIVANLDSLRPILTNLSKVSTSLPEALKIAVTIPFPAMTTTNALRGDYANLFATVDVRGSAFLNTWLSGLVPSASGASGSGATSLEQLLAPVTAKPPSKMPSTPGASPTTPKPNTCLLAILGVC